MQWKPQQRTLAASLKRPLSGARLGYGAASPRGHTEGTERMTYHDMAQAARNMDADTRAQMALLLLRIYEADRTQNNGLVTGEAVICGAFASEAKHLLTHAGVLK